MESRSFRVVAFAGFGLIVVIGIVYMLVRGGGGTSADPASVSRSTPADGRIASTGAGIPGGSSSTEAGQAPTAAEAPSTETTVDAAAPASPATQAPARTPFDPEQQPRTTYVMDFREVDSLPPGFKLEGLELTAEGIKLQPGTDRGVLTSPDEFTEFPGNSFAPLWRQKLPDGSRIDVELALSPEGATWGPWTRAIADDEAHSDIFPTYPDGSPNPFYGFTPGGAYNWGEERWQAFRYRMVLSREGNESPVLEAVRFYYQDSTLGEGRPGSVESLESLAAQLAPSESTNTTGAP